MDAKFLNVDTANLSQFTDSLACRDYTQQQKNKRHNQKDGSKGTQRLGRFWLQPIACMVSVELRSEIGL